LAVASLQKIFSSACYIYDVHENYGEEVLVRHWIPNYLRIPMYFLVNLTERICAKWIHNAVLVVPVQMERFSRYGCQTALVRNYAISTLAPARHNDVSILSDSCYVFNSGGQTESNGSRVYLEAAKILSQRGCKIPFVGIDRFDGNEELKNSILAALGRENLDYRLVPRVLPHQMVPYLKESIIGISCKLDTQNHRYGINTKLFEYMAFGIPIVASDVGYQADIIKDSKGGLLVAPGDPKALADAIERLWNDPKLRMTLGKNGREAFFDRYCWEKEALKLVEFYKNLESV
jgi:glycosyltransferase involved in cell wall biosynthesis